MVDSITPDDGSTVCRELEAKWFSHPTGIPRMILLYTIYQLETSNTDPFLSLAAANVITTSRSECLLLSNKLNI